MTIEEITGETEINKIIEALKDKNVGIKKPWSELELEYDPMKHSIMTDPTYQDVIVDGVKEKVTRVVYGLQKLSVNRMSGFMYGIPVTRNYKTTNEQEIQAAEAIENIMQRTRIDAVNLERAESYFAACEMLTIWYAKEEENTIYGFPSKLKFRCKNYSPMKGDELYPLFDDDDDMIALSVGYKRKKKGKEIEYFDTLTKDQHIRYKKEGGDWIEDVKETIILGKISGVYEWRDMPIWEDNTTNVEEIEWSLSRNGNYIRKNSKPLLVLFADEEIEYDKEQDEKKEFKMVAQYEKGGDAKYVTWEAAIEALDFQVKMLKEIFFTSIQMPDISFENMQSKTQSGEARKQMLVDMFIKVVKESGKLLKFADREMNIVKAYLKIVQPKLSAAIDSLQVEQIITPFTISDEKEKIQMIMSATGGMRIMSQKKAIQILGYVDDIDGELEQIQSEDALDGVDIVE